MYDFEVQIRTRDMHLVAEFGSAAHSLYIDRWESSDRMVPSFSPGNETRRDQRQSWKGLSGMLAFLERVFVVAEGGRVLTLARPRNL